VFNSKKVLFLMGYDHVNALKDIIKNPNVFGLITENNLQFIQEENLRYIQEIMGDRFVISSSPSQDIHEIINEQNICIMLTLGWRKLINTSEFNHLELLVNVHPAILPQYKGYHPVPHVLLNKETEHGITAHILTKEMDAGDIILKQTFSIDSFSTLKSLQNRVNELMPHFLSNLFEKLQNESNITLESNDDTHTIIRAPKRIPADSEIKFSASILEAYHQTRACDPDRFPAFLLIAGEKVYLSFSREKNANRSHKFDV